VYSEVEYALYYRISAGGRVQRTPFGEVHGVGRGAVGVVLKPGIGLRLVDYLPDVHVRPCVAVAVGGNVARPLIPDEA